MTSHHLTMLVLPDVFAVCRLDPSGAVPSWTYGAHFFSITRTADELSVVCPEQAVPEGIKCEKAWRCLRVAGTIDFAAVGILASLVAPLAGAGISVFAISTFDTDYLLVKENDLARALVALSQAGHRIK
jgi:hypothetical protein